MLPPTGHPPREGTEMLSTKIRTGLIALAATSSVAAVAVAPTGAQAMGIKLVTPRAKVTVCHQETILTPYGFAQREKCELVYADTL